MTSLPPTTRWVVRIGLALAAAVAWAALSRAAALFEVRPGLTFFFPAAIVTVVAGARLGWLGVAAIAAGNFILPWGAATDLLSEALFAIPAALWTALLVLMPRSQGSTWTRLRRFIVYGIVGGSLAGSLVGAAALTYVKGPITWTSFSMTAALWWISDCTPALALGLPAVILLMPDLLLDGRDLSAWREWRTQSREVGRTVALGVGGSLLLLVVSRLLGSEVHWFVALLLPAVIAASVSGGVAAGLVANGVVSSVYLALVLGGQSRSDTDVIVALGSTYANIALFAAFALLAGVLASRNRQLVEHVRQQGEVLTRGLEETVEALAAAMQTKERSSLGHVERVTRLAVLVGREMGLRGEELAVLRRAATLHDVGKIGVPEAILNKAAELELAEREVLQQHVEMGVEILQRVEFLHPVLAVVRYSQERWDGSRSGPYAAHYGLKGAEIPVAARVIAAVEAFDAISHDRPYRRALGRNAAIAELWRCSGSQFDPAVVAALTRVVGQERDISGDDSEAIRA
jgi:HD-GYP domain-containing protein (c-di-GMP phosphodiesterase class II)